MIAGAIAMKPKRPTAPTPVVPTPGKPQPGRGSLTKKPGKLKPY